MIVAGTPDIRVGDRPIVTRGPGRGRLIEPVVEDRPDRSIGARADVERPAACRFNPLAAEAFDETDDTEAGPEALFGMRAIGQDLLAQQGRAGTDRRGLGRDALDRGSCG